MSFHYFRDKDGAEVDIVIERGATRVAGVEVKASGTVRAADFRGLRKTVSGARNLSYGRQQQFHLNVM